jgi:post-segregation antitoxin (ccd killing protein)
VSKDGQETAKPKIEILQTNRGPLAAEQVKEAPKSLLEMQRLAQEAINREVERATAAINAYLEDLGYDVTAYTLHGRHIYRLLTQEETERWQQEQKAREKVG